MQYFRSLNKLQICRPQLSKKKVIGLQRTKSQSSGIFRPRKKLFWLKWKSSCDERKRKKRLTGRRRCWSGCRRGRGCRAASGSPRCPGTFTKGHALKKVSTISARQKGTFVALRAPLYPDWSARSRRPIRSRVVWIPQFTEIRSKGGHKKNCLERWQWYGLLVFFKPQLSHIYHATPQLQMLLYSHAKLVNMWIMSRTG